MEPPQEKILGHIGRHDGVQSLALAHPHLPLALISWFKSMIAHSSRLEMPMGREGGGRGTSRASPWSAAVEASKGTMA